MHSCGNKSTDLHLLTSETAQLTIVVTMAENIPVSLLGDVFQFSYKYDSSNTLKKQDNGLKSVGQKIMNGSSTQTS